MTGKITGGKKDGSGLLERVSVSIPAIPRRIELGAESAKLLFFASRTKSGEKRERAMKAFEASIGGRKDRYTDSVANDCQLAVHGSLRIEFPKDVVEAFMTGLSAGRATALGLEARPV